MNKSYRSIWNEALGAWVAVSEIETSRGKPSGSLLGRSVRRIVALPGFSLNALMLALAALGWAGQAQAADAYCMGATTQTYTAAGDQVVCGEGASATGAGGIAIGASTTFSGLTYASASSTGAGSIALGGAANVASGTVDPVGAAAAVGFASFANGAQAVALGTRARAEVTQSIAIGNDTRATGTGSVSIGGDDTGSGGYSSATFPVAGYTSGRTTYRATYSAGEGSTAIAPHAQALTKGSTAVGVGATAGEGTMGAVTGSAGMAPPGGPAGA